MEPVEPDDLVEREDTDYDDHEAFILLLDAGGSALLVAESLIPNTQPSFLETRISNPAFTVDG